MKKKQKKSYIRIRINRNILRTVKSLFPVHLKINILLLSNSIVIVKKIDCLKKLKNLLYDLIKF